jgi:hypothetical protein
VAEGARLAGQPRRVALVADRGDDELADALDREGSRPDVVSGRARHGLGLSGQDRFVDEQPGRGLQPSVRHDLVARAQPHQIAGDDFLDRDLSRRPVADDGRRRRDQRGEAVERLLGPNLLPNPDCGVREQDREEQRVLPGAERERDHPEDEQDQVEEREDVRADDARVRAARRLGLDGAALVEAPLRVGLGEPGRGGRRWDRDGGLDCADASNDRRGRVRRRRRDLSRRRR